MKHIRASGLIVGMLAIAGCASGTAGGPGANDSVSVAKVVGQADQTFRLTVEPVALRQGETKSVAVVITRALNFSEDVTLSFSDLPRGLSIDNPSPQIGHGDTEARFVLAAANDASLGEFSLVVTGRPTQGRDATNTMHFTVRQK